MNKRIISALLGAGLALGPMCAHGQDWKTITRYDKAPVKEQLTERFLKYVKKDHVNQKDIEEFFHISNPTVTGLLNRMEQKGYVVRIHSPDDKRIRYIQITDKVEDIDKKIKKHIDYSEGVIAKGLSQEERNLLFKLLAKVKDNLIKEEENHVKDID